MFSTVIVSMRSTVYQRLLCPIEIPIFAWSSRPDLRSPSSARFWAPLSATIKEPPARRQRDAVSPRFPQPTNRPGQEVIIESQNREADGEQAWLESAEPGAEHDGAKEQRDERRRLTRRSFAVGCETATVGKTSGKASLWLNARNHALPVRINYQPATSSFKKGIPKFFRLTMRSAPRRRRQVR